MRGGHELCNWSAPEDIRDPPEVVVWKGNTPIDHLCLSKFEESWREDLDVVEGVVVDHDLLDAVVIEIHREINEADTWNGIDKHVITDRYICERRDRALESDMLHIDRDASIDPPSVDELIISERDVAVILRVDHGCVPAHIEARENIIMPYLIISNESFCVQRTLWETLINGYSVDRWYVYQRIRDVNVSSLLSHHHLLSKLKDAVIRSYPFVRREVREEEGIFGGIFVSRLIESYVFHCDIAIVDNELPLVTVEDGSPEDALCDSCVVVVGWGPCLGVCGQYGVEVWPRPIVPLVVDCHISQVSLNIIIRIILVRPIKYEVR
jgi:hypothetical protein